MFKRLIQKIRDLNKEKGQEVNNSSGPKVAYTIHPNLRPEWLSGNIEIPEIPDVFQLLLAKDEKIKLQAAEILNHVVSSLSSSQLVKVSDIFRERSSIGWHYDWRSMAPTDLLHPSISEEEKLTILGLCTFHPNGYFREKAVTALSAMRTGGEIPYLLIRINDWVCQVRRVSKEKLLTYLAPEYATSFVNNLPLVYRLTECSRDEHEEIIKSVTEILCSAEGVASLVKGMQSIDSKVRLASYKVILERNVLNNRSVVEWLMNDKNPYNRLFILKDLMRQITFEEFTGSLQLLLHDRLAKIRVIALDKMYELQLEQAADVLEKSLFDKSRSVRETARYLLLKYKKYDFAAIYREAIQNSGQVYSAISGLGETGKAEDSGIIGEFLNCAEVKIVKASVNALAQLELQGHKEEFIRRLGDKRPGISKAAKRVLCKEIDTGDAGSIYEVFKNTSYEHVKVNTCELLCSLSKWAAMRYVLEFCADENKRISALGQRALEGWKLRFNYSFTSPTGKQLEEIRRALADLGGSIKDSDRSYIEFSIRDFIK